MNSPSFSQLFCNCQSAFLSVISLDKASTTIKQVITFLIFYMNSINNNNKARPWEVWRADVLTTLSDDSGCWQSSIWSPSVPSGFLRDPRAQRIPSPGAQEFRAGPVHLVRPFRISPGMFDGILRKDQGVNLEQPRAITLTRRTPARE